MEFLTWFSKFYDRFGDEKGHNKFMPQNLTVTCNAFNDKLQINLNISQGINGDELYYS